MAQYQTQGILSMKQREKKLDNWQKNHSLVSENFSANHGHFSSITTGLGNAKHVAFAPTWHRDQNAYVILSSYAGVATKYASKQFNPKNWFIKTLKWLFGDSKFEYQLSGRGKSIHKGYFLVGDNAPLHLGPKQPGRIIGIAGTLSF